MPFLKAIKKPHECLIPTGKRYYKGSVWQCPSCKVQYMLTDRSMGKCWRKMDKNEYLVYSQNTDTWDKPHE